MSPQEQDPIRAMVEQAVAAAGTYEIGQTPFTLERLDPPQTQLDIPASGDRDSMIVDYLKDFKKEQLRAIIRQRYTVSHFFIPFLETLIEASEKQIAKLPEGDEAAGYVLLRNVIADNRDEEIADLANPYATRPHPEGRQRLLIAMGMSEEEHRLWAAGLGTNIDDLGNVPFLAREVIEYHRDLAKTNILAAAVAFLDYEKRITNDYPHLLAGVTKGFGYSTEGADQVTRDTAFSDIPEVWHLYDHIGHDDDHAAAVKKAIEVIVKTSDDIELVEQTILDTRRVWQDFWYRVGLDLSELEFLSGLVGPLIENKYDRPDRNINIGLILTRAVARLR